MRFYTQERCWMRRLRPYFYTYRCYVRAQLKFVCACATTALYMRGSRQSSTETDGQTVKTDFRSRSKGQGQFLTVKNLDRGRECTYNKCLSDHPLMCVCVCLSPLILALQAPNRLMNDTNDSSTTSARKIMWRFR